MSRENPTMTVDVSASALWADRNFRYLIVWPGVFVLLLVGLFPFIYSLIVSFQNITARREDTSWHGFDNYLKLISDDRFWGSLMKTGIMTGIALPRAAPSPLEINPPAPPAAR